MLRECVAPLMYFQQGSAETLVVDDGSSDNTDEVCAGLAREYGSDRLRYCRLDRNQGAPVARNRGILESRGDYIMFVDSDDVIAAHGLDQLMERLSAHPEWDYAYGKVALTDQALVPLARSRPIGAPFRAETPEDLAGYHWHTMGALYRRRCIERVGPWNEELTGSQDWEYQARVKLFGGRGEFVDAVVGYWRQHDSGRVGTRRFRADYVESVMKACASILDHSRAVGRCDSRLEQKLAKRLVVHALEWGANGYRNERRRCLDQALQTAPQAQFLRSAIRLLALCPVVFDRGVLGLIHRLQGRA